MTPEEAWQVVIDHRMNLERAAHWAAAVRGCTDEEDDLAQEGLIAAWRAAQRWDPDQGKSLRRWMWRRTQGAALDAKLALYGPSPGPRVERPPTHIDMDCERCTTQTDASGERVPLAEHTDAFSTTSSVETQVALSRALDVIRGMDERTQRWVMMRAGGMRCVDVGRAEGVTEARVSQVVGDARRKLKEAV